MYFKCPNSWIENIQLDWKYRFFESAVWALKVEINEKSYVISQHSSYGKYSFEIIIHKKQHLHSWPDVMEASLLRFYASIEIPEDFGSISFPKTLEESLLPFDASIKIPKRILALPCYQRLEAHSMHQSKFPRGFWLHLVRVAWNECKYVRNCRRLKSQKGVKNNLKNYCCIFY